MSDLLQSLTVSASGLAAQAERLSIVSQNIANADTPGYQRKQVTFAEEFSAPGTAGPYYQDGQQPTATPYQPPPAPPTPPNADPPRTW